MLIAAIVPATSIQAYLGHSSSKVTMDIYGHLYDDASDAATDAMGAVLASSAPKTSNVRTIRG